MNNSGKSRPVLLTFAILAGVQVLTAGAGLSDLIGAQAVGLIILVAAAVQAGMSFYVQAQVVPYADAAAYMDSKGNLIAGPASPPQIRDGSAVEVTKNAGV